MYFDEEKDFELQSFIIIVYKAKNSEIVLSIRNFQNISNELFELHLGAGVNAETLFQKSYVIKSNIMTNLIGSLRRSCPFKMTFDLLVIPFISQGEYKVKILTFESKKKESLQLLRSISV